MKRFFKKLDTYLATNKPHIWLSRVHIVLPIAILLLIITVILLGHLPITTNIYWVLITGCIISLGFITALLRFQYLYYHKNFNARQLRVLFLVNLLSISLLFTIAVYIPFKMGSRANQKLEYVNFTDISNDIRIAMMRSDLIDSIRAGVLDSTISQPLQGTHIDLMDNITHNKFITQALTELDFNGSAGAVDSTVAVLPDTAIAMADSATKYADTTVIRPDTAKISNNTAKTPEVKANGYNYSDFLKLLRAKTPEEIAVIKNTIGETFTKFEFSRYGGDTSVSSINGYYDILNKESLNLYSTKTFYGNFGIIGVILFVLLVSLSQFSILVFNRNNAALVLTSLLLFYCLVGFLISSLIMTPSGLPAIAPAYMLAIIGLTIFLSKVFNKKPAYSAFNIVAFNLLNFIYIYMIALVAFLIYYLFYLLGWYFFTGSTVSIDYIFKDPEGDLSIVRPMIAIAIFIFLLFKTYKRLIQRLNWISALPRK